jgi:hypothetical protein
MGFFPIAYIEYPIDQVSAIARRMQIVIVADDDSLPQKVDIIVLLKG